MNNLNSILIEGNLVRDPLLRSTPKGTPVCTLRLASNRFYKQDSGFEREVSFFDVETWSKLAEACYNKGHKGRGIRVVGRLKQDRWNDTEGKPQSKITIVAEHVEFRPEFKKDENTQSVITQAAADPDSSYSEDSPESMSYTGNPEPVLAMAEEMEPVVF